MPCAACTRSRKTAEKKKLAGTFSVGFLSASRPDSVGSSHLRLQQERVGRVCCPAGCCYCCTRALTKPLFMKENNKIPCALGSEVEARVVRRPAAACFQHAFNKHLSEKCHFSKWPLVTEGRFLPASCAPAGVGVDDGGVHVTEGDYRGRGGAIGVPAGVPICIDSVMFRRYLCCYMYIHYSFFIILHLHFLAAVQLLICIIHIHTHKTYCSVLVMCAVRKS